MCERPKRPPRQRTRKARGRLVLVKEDYDLFQQLVIHLADELASYRQTHEGIEIEQGDRHTLYLPRIRSVL